MERRKRGRAGGFDLDTAERRTILLWCLTGVGGSGVFVVALLCLRTGWEDVAIWIGLLLPVALIGIAQRAILRRRCGAASSGFWLAGSLAGDLALLAAALPADERLELAFIVGVLGMIPGFIQMQALDHQFVRGDWWMTLSGVSYALGCTLAYAVGNALPWGTDAGAMLSYPCVSLFTGVGIVFVTQDRLRPR